MPRAEPSGAVACTGLLIAAAAGSPGTSAAGRPEESCAGPDRTLYRFVREELMGGNGDLSWPTSRLSNAALTCIQPRLQDAPCLCIHSSSSAKLGD